jgi:hypothetical protein
MKTILVTVLSVAVLSLVSLGAVQNHPAEHQHSTADNSTMQNCPMKVPGAQVAASDTADGVALTFTTSSGDVAELRRRVETMAKMHSMAPGPGMHEQMIPFTAKVEEVPNGARVLLSPKDPAKLEEFRGSVEKHVENMNNGGCTMMQGMMGHADHHAK